MCFVVLYITHPVQNNCYDTSNKTWVEIFALQEQDLMATPQSILCYEKASIEHGYVCIAILHTRLKSSFWGSDINDKSCEHANQDLKPPRA